MRRLLGALFLIALAAADAQAQSVATDRVVYGAGDTIAVTYDNPGEDEVLLALQTPMEVLEGRTHYPYERRIWGGDAGIWTIPVGEFLSSIGSSYTQDASRSWLRIAILQAQGGKYVERDGHWILLQRYVTPARGTLRLPGRDRFVIGETIEIALTGIEALYAANQYDPPFHDTPPLYAELWKAGRVLPGGVHLPDIRGYATYYIPDGATTLRIHPQNEPLVDELGYWGVGHYELRLHGVTGALLDRVQFVVALPPASAFALSLDPPPEGPYDYSAGPYVDLSVEPQAVEAFRSFLRPDLFLCPLDPSGALACLDSTGHPYVVDNVLAGEPAGDAVYVSGGVRPGAFSFILTGTYELVGAYAYFQLAKLASIPFEIGGDYPPQWLPTRPEPRLDFGDVALTLASGDRATIGQPMVASVALPQGVPLGQRVLQAKVFPAEDYGFDCWPLFFEDDVYQIGLLTADADGRLSFTAPPVPGRYELRLMEANSRGEMVTLARAFFTVEVPVPYRPLWLESSSVVPWGESVTVAWQLPTDLPVESAMVLLYRSAERLPGGAWRAAAEMVRAPVEDGNPSSLPRGQVTIGPFAIPGPYEIRLMTGAGYDEYRLARVFFDVLPPEGAPPLPDDAPLVREPSLDDWPAADDPRRGLAVWAPAAAECVEPTFPEPPALRLVERFTGDPEDDSDDRYAEVSAPFPGHPYHIEATFGTAPPEADYRVKVSDRLRVVVSRTADPTLYRSEAIVLWNVPAP